VAEQARLHVISSERLAQQRVRLQVDLADRQVVRGAPVAIEEVELGVHDRDARAIIVYAINAGSSSLKLAAFDHETLLSESEQGLNGEGIAALADLPPPDAIGHRVVHGGASRWKPALIDDDVLTDIEAAGVFAPRHQPAALAGIKLTGETFPGVAQVACFDTAFHHDLPPVAQTLPLPGGASGVRRYGFHGLSYEWTVSTLGSQLGERAVIAHLGSGSSLAAVLHGRAHDTTMGLTPIGGLMMSSRSGDVDPGALVHLMRSRGLDADGLERLVEDESGLLGVSGFSRDMRELLEARPTDPRAALAVDLWVMTVRKHIGAMTAALGGIDTLVFTGGIGERSQVLRDEICAGLAYLGGFTVHVVAADENRIVARHTAKVVSSSG
jgi:acetate kinase